MFAEHFLQAVPRKPRRLGVMTVIGVVAAAVLPTVSLGCGEGATGADPSASVTEQFAASPALPAGLGPNELRSAYNIPPGGGAGMTVAVLVFRDSSSLESDLAVYRSAYGLPACTTANGCFMKANQYGQTTPLSPTTFNWRGEQAFDVEMVSAACPSCKILVVEVAYIDELNVPYGILTAAQRGASAVSMSFMIKESSIALMTYPGLFMAAGSGDWGYQAPGQTVGGSSVRWPASSPAVIAVGGTVLQPSATGGWTEGTWGSYSAPTGQWTGSGSFCSETQPKPIWQKDIYCATRTVADISAAATGIAAYCTNCFTDDGGATVYGGWIQASGTSLATPLVAGAFAVTGGGVKATPAWIYAHASSFNDVTSGANGPCATGLCNAKSGYDGPTGLGTPNITKAIANGLPWYGCNTAGVAACTENTQQYPYYFDNHPACYRSLTCNGVFAACSTSCPPPTDADKAPAAGVCGGTSGTWAGCRGNGCAVCTEKLTAYPYYFVNHPGCTSNPTCAGSYYTCNSNCPAPTSADTYPPSGACQGTSSPIAAWSGCRGNGCAVCSELVSSYPHYFQNHPNCVPNPTCGGSSYRACNSNCPAPTVADL